MINRILVPLDGSKLAEGVLPYVEDIARRMTAQVTFAQVVDTDIPHEMQEALRSDAMSAAEQSTEMHVKAARDYLSGLANTWREKGIETSVEVALISRLLSQVIEPGWEVGMTERPSAEGTPAGKIVELAHEARADLIAMSTHGRSGLRRVFFGSVADRVLRESGIPVLLIRAAGRSKEAERA